MEKNFSTSGISTFEFTNVLLAFASGSVSPRTLTNRKFNKTKFIKKKSSLNTSEINGKLVRASREIREAVYIHQHQLAMNQGYHFPSIYKAILLPCRQNEAV